jgi:DnaK suppressor protein
MTFPLLLRGKIRMVTMTDFTIPSSYDPLNDPHYMSGQMLNYFKNKLMEMHTDILKKEKAISLSLADDANREADPTNQGVNEELHIQDFTFQEHEDQLRHEVELALKHIEEGIYGYCEETDEPIGVKRLLAVPYARYCLKIQKYKENERKRLTGR